jgi:hypothetical protein
MAQRYKWRLMRTVTKWQLRIYIYIYFMNRRIFPPTGADLDQNLGGKGKKNCHYQCHNHIRRVIITLCMYKSLLCVLIVEITVISVVITFARVKISMCMIITLCVYKSHLLVSCQNHSFVSWKLNRSRNHIRACKSHNACVNYTLCVEITLERVVITLVSVIFTRIRI